MSRSRRREDATLAFDISATPDAGARDDGGAQEGSGGPDGAVSPAPRPSWRDRWRAASPRRRRRAAALVGTAGVVVVGGVAVAGAVSAHVDAERLRSAPGGVMSLDGELAEAWQTPGDVVTPLDGGRLLVVEGESAVAREITDGDERWRVELGADPECGPRPRLGSGVEWTMPAGTVTCLHGPAEERTVTVLDADGTAVGQRVLDPQRYAGADVFVTPAADGGLAVAEQRVDLPPTDPSASVDEQFATLEELGDEVIGVPSVRVEDALTGEVRDELPVGSSSMSVADCAFVVTEEVGPGEGSARIVLSGSRRPVATPALVGYDLCGNAGAVTTAGKPLDLDGGLGVASFVDLDPEGQVLPFPGGGVVVPRGLEGSALLSDDGTERREDLSARMVAPQAQVGAVDPEIVAVEQYASVLGHDGDGDGDEERWRTSVDQPRVLARAAGVTLVASPAENVLIALDDTDGSERWRADIAAPDAADGSWTYPTSAVSDGDRVTVAAVDMAPDITRANLLLTVDLATGDLRRQHLDADGVAWVTAADGHLLLHDVDPAPGIDDPTSSSVRSVRILEPR